MKNALKFLTWPTIAGLLAAVLILDKWILQEQRTGANSHQATFSYARAVANATPSVVNIYTAKLVSSQRSPLLQDRFFRQFARPQLPRNRIERSLGSGVIMTDKGHILTNEHVITGADAIQVLLHDGRSANAVVIGSDPATDLAVLQVDLPELQPFQLGDANAARVGDVVLAIGNPLGFGHSVTQGIVSALGRYGLQLNAYENYIQTDAIIHQGNSGGALIDTRGRLLGINALIYTGNNSSANATTGIGISLAIPVDLAEFVMRDLIEYGEVIRGWLGVSVEPVGSFPDGRTGQRALAVVAIGDDSPARKAGLQVGDIITHIDGKAVGDGRLATHHIAMLRPGDSVRISVQRNQQSLEINAIVGVLRQSNGG